MEQPFASELVARKVPPTGGDMLWASCCAVYDRLPDGMKSDLVNLNAAHNLGDFRNSFSSLENGQSPSQRLNQAVSKFGHNVRRLIDQHPISVCWVESLARQSYEQNGATNALALEYWESRNVG